MSQALPSIRGVAEIVIRVSDLALARSFYEGVLGFQFVSQHPSDTPGIMFLQIAELESDLGAGGHHQLLALVDRGIHRTGRAFEGLKQEHTSLDHVAFEIPPTEYEAWRQRLDSAGVEIHLETTFPDMRARAIFGPDPEGNLIELICHDTAS